MKNTKQVEVKELEEQVMDNEDMMFIELMISMQVDSAKLKVQLAEIEIANLNDDISALRVRLNERYNIKVVISAKVKAFSDMLKSIFSKRFKSY